MSWSEVIWLKNKTERDKRLTGSQTSIAKVYETVHTQSSILEDIEIEIGTFVPKYSGVVTIVSELNGTTPSYSGWNATYGIFVNGTRVYYNTSVSLPYITETPNIVYQDIPVSAGQEYSIKIVLYRASTGNNTLKNMIKIGTILSESTLIE